MKKILMLILSALLVLTCASCGGKEDEGSDSQPKSIDVKAEADAIIQKYSLSGGEYYSSQSGDNVQALDDDLIRSYFGDATSMPDFSGVEAYALYIDETKPLKPCEFGIFKMKEGADKGAFLSFLEARIELKKQNAVAYPTLDTEPLKTAKFTINGDYIWYCAVSKSNEEINSNLEGKL